MSIQAVIYKRSYDGIQRLIHKLKINIRNCPEELQRRREILTYRLEMLYIIRQDLKKCIKLA